MKPSDLFWAAVFAAVTGIGVWWFYSTRPREVGMMSPRELEIAYAKWKRLAATSHGGDELSAVVVNDGIDEIEAYALASAYFYSRVNGCGLPLWPTDGGSHWIAETRVGYAGVVGNPIRIEKRAGVITRAGNPTVTTIAELRRK